jgi:uncharacterized caspase-like protein
MKYALTIGNDKYEQSPLGACKNDATDVAISLQSIGFQVQNAVNVDSRATDQYINRFLRSIQPESIAVFYFSGHGLQLNGENYLVPTNNYGMDLDNLDQVSLNAQQLVKAMHNRNPKLILIILDCCRSYWHTVTLGKSSFFNRRSGKFRDGLAPMRAPPATIIVYACAADTVSSALSINNRNSLYTYHLLNHIRTPNLDIDTVLKNVGIDVQRDPVNMEHQVPFRYSSCNEVIFLAGNGPINYSMSYGYKQLEFPHRKSFFRSSKHIHFKNTFRTI